PSQTTTLPAENRRSCNIRARSTLTGRIRVHYARNRHREEAPGPRTGSTHLTKLCTMHRNRDTRDTARTVGAACEPGIPAS
ncbi:MAG: hypothetical protein OXU61_09275, partial [Gammaproteobacteria bacterium]|nr:hypothetical protein [Gammaproteobacteria bacterium]